MIYVRCLECGCQFEFRHIWTCEECGSGNVAESFSRDSDKEDPAE